MANPMRAILVLAAFLPLAACRDHAPPPPSPPPSASAPSTTPSASASAPPPTIPQPAPLPLDRRAYEAAVAEGRTATRAGRYPEAIAAFDRALVAWPYDPQAISERGYARLLAGDLAAAEDDLHLALRTGPRPVLGAQLWYNLGLVAEKRGDDKGARAAFARSILLAPTGAARGKLAARDTCGAVVERRPEGPGDALFSSRLLRASGWLDAYQRIYAGQDPKVDSPPTTEAEAKRSLCERFGTDRCTGAGPWKLSRFLNSALAELEDHVFPEAGGALLVFHTIVARTTEITRMNELTCVTEQTLDIRREPGVLHVALHTDWTTADLAADPNRTCPPPRVELEDVIYDVATCRELLRVTRAGGNGAASVRVVGRTAELSAGTCRATLPLDGPSAPGRP